MNDFATEWGDGFGIVRKEDLRAEAIKWIKELKPPVANDKEYKIIPYDLTAKDNVRGAFHYEIFESQWTYRPQEVINFIKHFFNITDEGFQIMIDKPYEAKEGSCFYCDKSTNQYYTEDQQWICNNCLFELEEEIAINQNDILPKYPKKP